MKKSLVIIAVCWCFGIFAQTVKAPESKQTSDTSGLDVSVAMKMLETKEQAFEKLANIKAESKALLQQAQEQQAQILKEAAQTSTQIVDAAKEKAQEEAARIIEDARRQIQAETERAQRDIRAQVADLSVQIAGKILSRELQKEDEQERWIDQILNQITEEKE